MAVLGLGLNVYVCACLEKKKTSLSELPPQYCSTTNSAWLNKITSPQVYK